MRSTRAAPVGGLPSGSPSVAEVTPTFAVTWAMANGAPDRANAAAPASAMRRSGEPTIANFAMTVS